MSDDAAMPSLRRERATRWAGLALALFSLAMLMINEGVLFDTQPPALDLDIRAEGCAPDPGGDPEQRYRIDIGDEGFLRQSAELELRLNLEPFLRRDCQTVVIDSDAAFRHFKNSGFYEPENDKNRDRVRGSEVLPAEPTPGIVRYRRNQNSAEGGPPRRDLDWEARFNHVRIILPGALKRVGGDSFSARVRFADPDARLTFVERLGQVGYASADRARADLTFRFSAYERVSRIVTIIFATLLGIGVGAVFEASLIIATARKIDAIRRDLETGGE